MISKWILIVIDYISKIIVKYVNYFIDFLIGYYILLGIIVSVVLLDIVVLNLFFVWYWYELELCEDNLDRCRFLSCNWCSKGVLLWNLLNEKDE